MRLVGFGPGEICDRLSVLALKLHYGQFVDKPLDHFAAEQEKLEALLPVSFNRPTFPYLVELSVLNAIIWTNTDEVRAIKESLGDEAAEHRLAELCVDLQNANDRRAVLIGLINDANGHSAPMEKVYRDAE